MCRIKRSSLNYENIYDSKLQHRKYSEVSIKVPWGLISGRWYGDQMQRPILALHGWQDSCGTFARLAPLIAPYRSLLCIDLPGHGHSTHLPVGVLYHNLEYVRVILRVMQVYKWQKVSLMGHSMGGSVCYHFAAFYPDRVDMVISLDIIKNYYWQPDMLPVVLRHVIDKALIDNDRLLTDNPTEPPSYTFSECEALLYEGSMKSVDLENGKFILERNITKSELYPDKYFFSRDGRIKYLCEMNPNMGLSLEMAKRICAVSMPYLVIKGGESMNISAKHSELDDYMQKNDTNFECFIHPSGTHHLHLNNPKPVAQLIISFLLKFDDQKQQLIKNKL